MKVFGADPYVLYDKESQFFYCYATSNLNENGQFYIYKSKDLIEWTFVRYALDTTVKNWGKDWFWAPECYFNPNNQHYYLFYSARVKKELVEKFFHDPTYEECARIGVAVSKSPEGPFLNITDEPMDYHPYDRNYRDVDQVYDRVFEKNLPMEKVNLAPLGAYVSSIDVNLLFENEKIFMYFSRCCYKNCLYDETYQKFIEESNIVGVELETDWWYDETATMMPRVKKQYQEIRHGRREDHYIDLITYRNQPQEWENGHINDYELSRGEKKNRRWAEGSTTFVLNLNHKHTYCTTYSCNNFESPLYGVGIAFSESPLGPYRKFDGNPIIHEVEENSLYSTGHGTIIEKNGEMFYFFHGRETVDEDRVLYCGKIEIQSIDSIQVSQITQCSLITETCKIKG